MNTQLFIRRPITTTLVMAAILIFGILAYRLLPVSDLAQRRLPHHPGERILPGASPDTMASAVATAAGKAVLHHRRPGLDDLVERAGLTPASRCSSTSSRNIDAAAQDVQATIAAAARAAAAEHARAAFVSEGESGRSADLVSGAQLADAAALRRRRIRRDD